MASGVAAAFDLIGLHGRDMACLDGRAVSGEAFADDVRRCAAALPDSDTVLNLCTGRYHFTVAFLAVLARGQCNLLPSNRTPVSLEGLSARYGPACILRDDDAGPPLPGMTVLRVDHGFPPAADAAPGRADPGALAVLAFTSGTTGSAKPIPKTRENLWAGTRINARYLPGRPAPAGLVATVPPWHMYGLEWSVLVPLVSPAVVCGDSAFFPEDVRRGLLSVPAPRLLITTPLHLRALLDAGAALPPVQTIMCATAPLNVALAERAECATGARVYEIFGCTEAGSLSFRWPTDDDRWQFFDAFAPRADDERTVLDAAHLGEPVTLADRLAFDPDGRFTLLGRDADLVKVAGKRASLAQLTESLLAVDSVIDAVFVVVPDRDGYGEPRLAAVVVTDGSADVDGIRTRLSRTVESVFLPRRLCIVDAIPRGDTGKPDADKLLEIVARP